MESSAPPPLAVIAGGTSGIGFSVAARLMQDGYDVLITGRNTSRGEEASRKLKALHAEGEAAFLALESSDWHAYGRLVDALASRPVSTVVASAAFGMQAHVIDTPTEAFHEMLAVNVAAPLHLVKTLRPHLSSHASIILISSDAGIDGEQALGAYSVTKAAVNMLGRMLALDLAPEGVRVNVVCPGDTVPGMRYLLRPGETERSREDYLAWPIPPRGRLGKPEDTAEFVAFLASPKADFMVGTVTLVDGGSRAGRPDAPQAARWG